MNTLHDEYIRGAKGISLGYLCDQFGALGERELGVKVFLFFIQKSLHRK